MTQKMSLREYDDIFWKKLDIARRNRQISWGELARQISISRHSLLVSRKRKTIFKVPRMITLCDVLQVSMDELCDPRIDIEPTYERKIVYKRRPEDLTDDPAWELTD